MFYASRTPGINTEDNPELRQFQTSSSERQSHNFDLTLRTFCKDLDKYGTKQKLGSECRTVKKQRGYQYVVIESSNRSLYIICIEAISVLKNTI